MDEQISIFDIMDNAADETSGIAAAVRKVSCCSKVRQCSELGRCVIAGADISKDCRYQLRLEAGDIFFGRRSKYFSQPDFDHRCAQFDSMDDVERETFLSCLYHFCDLCFSTCFAGRSAELESLAARGLIKLYPFPAEMVRRMHIFKGMYPLLGEIGAMDEWLAWGKEAKAESSGKCTRPDLCAEFLLENYLSELEAHFAGFCVVDLPPDMRLRFADEFYAEHGAPMRAHLHDLPDPLLADVRFKRGGR